MYFSDTRLPISTPASSIPAAIRDRISVPAQPRAWTSEDFADLERRTAVDPALPHLVASRNSRRIARGFYDLPQDNRLTGKSTYPNPRDVIDARARKGKVRVVVDGINAANDFGLTNAVPARIGVLTDGRLRPITHLLRAGVDINTIRPGLVTSPSIPPISMPRSISNARRRC